MAHSQRTFVKELETPGNVVLHKQDNLGPSFPYYYYGNLVDVGSICNSNSELPMLSILVLCKQPPIHYKGYDVAVASYL